MTNTVNVLAVLALAGLALTTLEVIAAWLFMWKARRRGRQSPDHQTLRVAFPRHHSEDPVVSILKPVAGVDDGFAANLASLARISGSRHEIIVSIASQKDPAVTVVEQVIADFPDAPLRLVIGGARRAANPKIERLIEAAERARGEIMLVSDAQVAITESQLVQTLAGFRDSEVGVISNLFIGEGARTFGAWVESTHLVTFVAAGNTLAAMANVPCLVGKSMAIPRAVLDRIGGFEAFSNVLAEDQAIALAVRRAGYRVALSPVVVRNRVVKKSVSAALARQVRWNKIRYAFSPLLYSMELLMHPVAWSLAAALAALSTGDAGGMMALSAVTLAARAAQGVALSVLFGSPTPLRIGLMAPVQDLLQFAAQFAPFFSNEVNWRGHRARLGRGTLIIPEAAS